MSLLLRKEGETLLNKYGFKDIYLTKEANNYLAIVGSCGKYLYTFHDIRFSPNPSTEEIQYGLKLADISIKANEDKLKEYLKLLNEYSTFKIEANPELAKYEKPFTFNGYVVYKNGEIKKDKGRSLKPLTITDLKPLTSIADELIAKSKEYYKVYEELQKEYRQQCTKDEELRLSLYKVKNELNSCKSF